MADTKVGTGAAATAGKEVSVHYTGWLYDAEDARPPRQEVRQLARPRRAVRVQARRPPGDQRLGSGRRRHEGRRRAHAHHSVRSRLRQPRRRRRDSAERDAASSTWNCSTSSNATMTAGRTDVSVLPQPDPGVRSRRLDRPLRTIVHGLRPTRIDRPEGLAPLPRHHDLRHARLAAVGARRGGEPPVHRRARSSTASTSSTPPTCTRAA